MDEERANQFEAEITWTTAEPLLPGRSYVLAIGDETVAATIAPLKYVIDRSGERRPATQLEFGETGVVELELDRRVAFETYERDPVRGAFEVFETLSGLPIGHGRIHFALRRSANVHWQATDIDRDARAKLNGHRSCIVWLTGLSGAGKSTIANLLEGRLHALGCHTYLLDGDNVRHGLNKDLGFTAADRVENIRRVGEVAKLMLDAGLIVIASFISPYRNERELVRSTVGEGEFFEVFVDVPLEVAEQRDPKGLYAKARSGELVNFTGVDAPYEQPEHPEVHVATDQLTPGEACAAILDALAEAGYVTGSARSARRDTAARG